MRRTILLAFVLLGCTQKTVDKAIDEDCPIIEFITRVGRYDIRAEYGKCEPNFYSKLTITNGDNLIFRADTSMEFEFKNHSLQGYHYISDNRDQILLEVSGRPLANYFLCLTIEDNRLVGMDEFHLLENNPKDFDNDGFLEFAGFRETIEGYSKDSTFYNPIQYVEKGANGFQIDTALTRMVSIRFYGKSPAMSPDFVYKKVPEDTLKKYLNVKE